MRDEEASLFGPFNRNSAMRAHNLKKFMAYGRKLEQQFQSQLCDTVRTTDPSGNTMAIQNAEIVRFQSQLCDTVRTTG